MNIFLWILQVLLALHTAVGAVWKISNPAQIIPSLSSIPYNVWMGLSVIELICSVFLVLPAIKKNLGHLVPAAAGLIALEMLVFIGLHLNSGVADFSPVIYWLVVAVICVFIAFARMKMNKLK